MKEQEPKYLCFNCAFVEGDKDKVHLLYCGPDDQGFFEDYSIMKTSPIIKEWEDEEGRHIILDTEGNKHIHVLVDTGFYGIVPLAVGVDGTEVEESRETHMTEFHRIYCEPKNYGTPDPLFRFRPRRT